jgi:outer membrane biosynthesis protein TonB
LILSLVLHGLVLAFALISFSAHNAVESPQPVSVDILTPAELSTIKAGKADKEPEKAAAQQSLQADKPAEIAASERKQTPSEKVSPKQAALPPPKPKSLPPTEAHPQPAEKREQAEEAPLPERPKREERPAPIRAAANSQSRKNPAEEKRDLQEKPRTRPDKIAELLGRPTPRAEAKSDFDPRKISALLNRDPTAGERPQQDGPREPWRKPASFQEQAAGFEPDEPERVAYGAPEGRDAQITANEIDAFRAQISRCWTPPVGGLGGDAIVVKLRITLNEDGSLGRQPEIANRFPSPFFRPAADSAVRAVVQCQPYRMPPEKYEQWRDMLLTFDPSQMYGG